MAPTLPPRAPTDEGTESVSIARGLWFTEQKACTKAVRIYAATHNMTVKVAAGKRRYRCLDTNAAEIQTEVTLLRSKRSNIDSVNLAREASTS
ncbi:hypothetical protein PHMEG_00011067 [Phytophthora megakarya]|uniref:Uncharacterized protein n=1 Tax=Phytophthora megakarya TaxID=4795 RepID=A0A225WC51_9STRA|nr:hypothetical protein PHMEG_00011067 [Phytophthora megakarya]